MFSAIKKEKLVFVSVFSVINRLRSYHLYIVKTFKEKFHFPYQIISTPKLLFSTVSDDCPNPEIFSSRPAPSPLHCGF